MWSAFARLNGAFGVLSEFLPHYDLPFGVPAVQAGPAYRVPDAGLDIDGGLCFKERRKVGRRIPDRPSQGARRTKIEGSR